MRIGGNYRMKALLFHISVAITIPFFFAIYFYFIKTDAIYVSTKFFELLMYLIFSISILISGFTLLLVINKVGLVVLIFLFIIIRIGFFCFFYKLEIAKYKKTSRILDVMFILLNIPVGAFLTIAVHQ